LRGFRAGWAYLTLVTVHIYCGRSIAVEPRRLEEITALANTIAGDGPNFSSAAQYEPGRKPAADNLLVLGDFNIFDREDVTMDALTAAGFIVPEALQAIPGSNVDKNKHDDRIAYHERLTRMRPTGEAGVFDFYGDVYRLDQEIEYEADRGDRGSSYKQWRTYRMSDHLPMWIEFGIDDADAYLGARGRAEDDQLSHAES
jgi:endonuclease/exonuclease/phosphatase family metal-dependent hydrolase